MTLDQIIEEFKTEFKPILDKFEIIKVLQNEVPYEYHAIRTVKRPKSDNNIIWHPGVYVFYGNGKPYRVGRHLGNSRARVLQHLNASTRNGKESVWSIKDAPDKEIVLFNVKDRNDYHWVAAVEIFMEKALKGELVIPAKRQG